MGEEVKGIYKKMLTIMDNVEYVMKDMHVNYGANDYKAVSEAAVIAAVRKHLIAQDVYVYCVAQERSRAGNLTSVDEVFRFVDLDDGSYIDVPSSGEGSDTQDKSVGKAQTYSFKYLFRRAFAIPIGEDPDKISSAELDDTQKRGEVDRGARLVSQLLEDHPELSEDYRGSIALDVDTAVKKEDVDTLRIIYKEVKAEIRKQGAPEAKANTDASFSASAKQLAEDRKYNQEPHLPEPQQEIF